MLYLSSVSFPDREREQSFRNAIKETCYQSIYPFFVLSEAGLSEICFKPITILYGGNGSGKTTALNVIAEKLRLKRASPYNRSNFFERYVDLCDVTLEEAAPPDSSIITSDDVFDMMLNIRAVNEGIDAKRERIADEYFRLRGERFIMRTMDDYDHLRRVNEARRHTKSRFLAEETGRSIREQSNGESALTYFEQRIADDSLCLLDEPENSLSPENQIKLGDLLAQCARYCGCQLIVSTHSPFLLALSGARIIDLDHGGRVADSWTQLENPQIYYRFFKEHEREFAERGL